MKLVSWLICVNEDNFLIEEALNSIKNQTYTNYEVILVVNGQYREVILERLKNKYNDWMNLKIINSNINYLPANLSLGLNSCKGEYVARLDSDDISYPNRCEEQVAFLELNPHVAVVGSYVDAINEDRTFIETIKVPEGHEDILKKIYFENPIKHPSVMYKRKVVLEAGGYLGPLLCEDYELWIRLIKKRDVIFANINLPLVQYSMVNRGGRRNKELYANVVSLQIRAFLLYGNLEWLIGATLNLLKYIYIICLKK